MCEQKPSIQYGFRAGAEDIYPVLREHSLRLRSQIASVLCRSKTSEENLPPTKKGF